MSVEIEAEVQQLDKNRVNLIYSIERGEKAKIAASNLSNININTRNGVLKQFSIYLKKNAQLILKSNRKYSSA